MNAPARAQPSSESPAAGTRMPAVIKCRPGTQADLASHADPLRASASSPDAKPTATPPMNHEHHGG